VIQFCIRRLFAIIPVGIGVVIVVSLLVMTVPGDPIDTILGPYATLAERQELSEKLGLSQPIFQQISTYFMKVIEGDLGDSLIYNRPVIQLISERVLPTVELAILSLLVAVFISIPLGILSAIKANKLTDYLAMGFALCGVAIPNFWLGPLLVLLFAVKLAWLPVSERTDLSSYVLPAITLGTALAAALSRMTRNSMLDNFSEDYVRTARAKGLSEFWVTSKHVLRNASIPLVTIVGLQFGVLLTGAIITERIFDWPGLGTLILEGIYNRDYPVVQGCVLVFSISYLAVNLLTDISYALIDPRIKPQ
jgi:peptide/nickel transport system permease protein